MDKNKIKHNHTNKNLKNLKNQKNQDNQENPSKIMVQTMKGYKNTEIGVIPEDWEVTNIAETSTLKARIGWQGLTTAEYLNTGDFHLVTGTDFKNGRIEWSTCHYVEKIRFTQDKNIQLKNEDILITKDGTIGKVAFVNNLKLPATLNSGVFVVRSKKYGYKPIFAFYIFNSIYFTKFLNELVAGSTINHLYQKDFVNFNFPLPPTIEEQTAIATVLSDTDNLLQAIEKKIAKKRLIKQGAMQELLKPKEGWVVKPLGKFVNFSNGKAHENHIDVNGEYIVVNSKFVSTGGKVFKSATENFSSLKKGDIVMVMSDIPNGKALAKCFLIPKDNKYALNQRICSIRTEEADTKFLFYILNRNKYYLAFDSGTGQTNLKKEDVLNCPIPLPSTKEEQTQIATILSDMDKEIENLEQQLAKYKQIKQGLMQNLLTGKIRLV